MTKDELVDRLHRCYAAIDVSVEGDLSKFPPKIMMDEKQFSMYQDFIGGLSDAQLTNLAYTIIHNISNLQNHLRRWARRNGLDTKVIDMTIAASPALQIIIDLSNNDKHGYPPRDGGQSRKSPLLREVKRAMKMSTGAAQGASAIAIVFTPSGPKQIFSGGGSAQVVVTGDVVDSDGAPLGQLYELGNEALQEWEQQLGAFGIRI